MPFDNSTRVRRPNRVRVRHGPHVLASSDELLFRTSVQRCHVPGVLVQTSMSPCSVRSFHSLNFGVLSHDRLSGLPTPTSASSTEFYTSSVTYVYLRPIVRTSSFYLLYSFANIKLLQKVNYVYLWAGVPHIIFWKAIKYNFSRDKG